MKANVELIETDKALEKYGVNESPAMIIEGKIVHQGGNYSVEWIKKILADYLY